MSPKSISLGFLSLDVGPWRSAHFKAMKCKTHVIAVGNRVLLRRIGDTFFAHLDLGFFVATSSKSSVIMGSSIHCAHSDILLAFALFLHGIKKGCFRPRRKGFIGIGDFSAKIKGPKGRQMAPLWIFVV